MPRRIDLIEDADRDVIALESVYTNGQTVDAHSHRRIQLLYGATGTMQLDTKFGTWVVPPGFAVWIPAGVPHQLTMTNVVTHSLYFRNTALADPPQKCQVIEVPPFLKELIREAIKVPLLYEPDLRDGFLMKMLLHEACIQPLVPLHLPMPRDPQLARLCQAFYKAPVQTATPQEWARQLHVSERTFYRRFLASTGMTFISWRQQACVFVAMSRLSLGQSVTAIALDMGYESPSSFSTMFKKSMGFAPSLYRVRH
ncbi:MAG: helix-turn-helix domain-containing protein [Candidimonas sp.]|nr:MAG: helix-turn-helix domain-containing protein [Candidimonas sp.]TAM21977.1 MAG: helix-turn-helix domain-containing protein [Candidimonas sp.]TAM76579.1 MAG: helix-turn-helix domain-containing protein [Candidimonas sp.]